LRLVSSGYSLKITQLSSVKTDSIVSLGVSGSGVVGFGVLS
jgi:hypothetical protein